MLVRKVCLQVDTATLSREESVGEAFSKTVERAVGVLLSTSFGNGALVFTKKENRETFSEKEVPTNIAVTEHWEGEDFLVSALQTFVERLFLVALKNPRMVVVDASVLTGPHKEQARTRLNELAENSLFVLLVGSQQIDLLNKPGNVIVLTDLSVQTLTAELDALAARMTVLPEDSETFANFEKVSQAVKGPLGSLFVTTNLKNLKKLFVSGKNKNERENDTTALIAAGKEVLERAKTLYLFGAFEQVALFCQPLLSFFVKYELWPEFFVSYLLLLNVLHSLDKTDLLLRVAAEFHKKVTTNKLGTDNGAEKELFLAATLQTLAFEAVHHKPTFFETAQNLVGEFLATCTDKETTAALLLQLAVFYQASKSICGVVLVRKAFYYFLEAIELLQNNLRLFAHVLAVFHSFRDFDRTFTSTFNELRYKHVKVLCKKSAFERADQEFLVLLSDLNSTSAECPELAETYFAQYKRFLRNLQDDAKRTFVVFEKAGPTVLSAELQVTRPDSEECLLFNGCNGSLKTLFVNRFKFSVVLEEVSFVFQTDQKDELVRTVAVGQKVVGTEHTSVSVPLPLSESIASLRLVRADLRTNTFSQTLCLENEPVLSNDTLFLRTVGLDFSVGDFPELRLVNSGEIRTYEGGVVVLSFLGVNVSPDQLQRNSITVSCEGLHFLSTQVMQNVLVAEFLAIVPCKKTVLASVDFCLSFSAQQFRFRFSFPVRLEVENKLFVSVDGKAALRKLCSEKGFTLIKASNTGKNFRFCCDGNSCFLDRLEKLFPVFLENYPQLKQKHYFNGMGLVSRYSCYFLTENGNVFHFFAFAKKLFDQEYFLPHELLARGVKVVTAVSKKDSGKEYIVSFSISSCLQNLECLEVEVFLFEEKNNLYKWLLETTPETPLVAKKENDFQTKAKLLLNQQTDFVSITGFSITAVIKGKLRLLRTPIQIAPIQIYY